MPTNPLDRLMWAQGNRCFFCDQPLPKDDASVEHLWAKANGGTNSDENCVVCCKAVNALLGSMSLKEKFKVVLNQQGQFRCPSTLTKSASPAKGAPKASPSEQNPDFFKLVVANLKQREAHAPKTLKTLTSTVTALLGNSHKGTNAHQIIEQMKATGVLTVTGTKAAYDFSRANIRPK